jgi:hypothetical protein
MPRVFGIHEIELRPGVKGEDFERFVVEEALPAQPLPGVQTHVLKGDRGDREGKYLVMFEFESVEHRDRLFPTPGQMSEEAQRLLEQGRAMWDKWDTLAAGPSATSDSTDYVKLGQG